MGFKYRQFSNYVTRLSPAGLGLLTCLLVPLSQPRAEAIPSPPSQGTCHSSLNAKVDQLTQAAAVEKDIPGLTVAITKDGRLVCNKGFGYANWDNKTPMQPESRAQIGSTTKVLVTTAMMKLIQDDGPLAIDTRVYGNGGILSDADYQNAIRQGVRRHSPLVGLAIGNNNQVNAWYSDGKFTFGSSDDLGKHQTAQDFSLPTGKTMPELIAIARGGQDNRVYSWYLDGSYSIGTASDLDAYGSFKTGKKEQFKSLGRKDTIVGIAVNKAGNRFYAHYQDGRISSGSSPDDLTNRWSDKTYQVPDNPQRRYNMVDVARSPNGKSVAWYSRGKASRGSVIDLGAEATFDYIRRDVPNSRQHWLDQYKKIEIRHLLSHTAGFSRSGDGPQSAIKYGYDNFDKNTNPVPYKVSNLYVLSTRPLLFDVGTTSQYSNHGMGLTGHLISELTGQSWYQYLRENILIPAGADNIVPRGLYQDATLDANPHFVSSNGTIQTRPLEVVNHAGSAAGSLKASAADLARVLVATDRLNNHPDVLYGNTISRMESRPFPEAAPNRAYGWGIKCQSADCSSKRLAHNGRTGGGTSYMVKYQNFRIGSTTVDGINVTVVANSGDAGTGNLRDLAKELALEAATSSFSVGYDLFVPGSNTIGVEQ